MLINSEYDPNKISIPQFNDTYKDLYESVAEVQSTVLALKSINPDYWSLLDILEKNKLKTYCELVTEYTLALEGKVSIANEFAASEVAAQTLGGTVESSTIFF